MLRITDVDYLGDYTLALTFNNDEKRVCDLKPYLSGEVFGELQTSPDKIGRAHV